MFNKLIPTRCRYSKGNILEHQRVQNSSLSSIKITSLSIIIHLPCFNRYGSLNYSINQEECHISSKQTEEYLSGEEERYIGDLLRCELIKYTGDSEFV